MILTMKRFICLCLAVVLTMSYVFAANDEVFDITTNGEEMRVLTDLKVIPADPQFNNEITRGEFADTIIHMMGFEVSPDAAVGVEAMFDDVYENHKYAASIALAVKAGIFSGDGNGSFRPDDSISVFEAVKVLVSILGYGYEAQTLGGYPLGYINAAVKIGLLENAGISNKILGRNILYKLVYNTLMTEVVLPSSYWADVDGKTGANYTVQKGRLFINEYLNVYVHEGIITTDSSMTIKDRMLTEDGEIYVDNQLYEVAVEMPNRVGYNVAVFYRKNKDVRTIISYLEGENRVITLTAENLRYMPSKRAYEYTEKKRTTDFVLTKEASYLYNDAVIRGSMATYVEPDNGFVTLVDNDQNGIYDVAFINDYDNIVVDRFSARDNILYQRENVFGSKVECNSFDLDDYDKVTVIDTEGKPVELDAITKDDIASVFESPEKEAITIKISTTTISGTVNSISSGKEKRFVIDGAEYVAAGDVKYDISTISAGNEYTFYLDFAGEIAYLTTKAKDNTYGYITSIGVVDEEAFGEPKGYLQILETNGVIATYRLAERVKVTYFDGNTKTVTLKPTDAISRIKTEGNKYFDADKGDNGARQIILYETKAVSDYKGTKYEKSYADEEYKIISSITLPMIAATAQAAEDNAEYPLIRHQHYFKDWTGLEGGGSIDNAIWRRSICGVDRKLIYDGYGQCFTVPPMTESSINEKYISVDAIRNTVNGSKLKVSNPPTGTTNEFEAYTYGGNDIENDIMITYNEAGTAGSVAEDGYLYMVTSIERRWNAKTSEAETVVMLAGKNAIAEYVLDDESMFQRAYFGVQKHASQDPLIDDNKTEIVAGDIIKIKASGNIINNLVLVYDSQNGEMSYEFGGVDLLFRCVSGTATRIGGTNAVEYQRPNGEFERVSFARPIVYDVDEETVHIGTMTECEKGDTIVMSDRWGEMYSFFIYKKAE